LEIYEFVSGELYFSADGNRIDIQPGDIVIITNGLLHRPIIKKESLYHRRRILVKNNFFIGATNGAQYLKQKIANVRVIKLNSGSSACSLCSELILKIKALYEKGDDYSIFCAETSITYLFIRALEECCKSPSLSHRTTSADVRSIIEYIDEHISSRLDYKSLAALVHKLEKNLYKIFKVETGFTLSKYIRERRIIIAKSLLNSGESPRLAAENVGFSDYSTFYRAFIRSVGMSPIQYASQGK
jgi:AraC-like DNA-binding protein